ncbi:gluconokinase [Actinotalea sp. Marseille-Q4924]|uniref:gluconokinase n=1 Tax=Actinotalea sp. Marseille-Q4924 TaxID=2866571 RepID=UPI001CE3FC15|nr:gluconokinase [Actinotalea sp. Marseille-Q4924]
MTPTPDPHTGPDAPTAARTTQPEPGRDVVVGVDLGTTSTKAVAFEAGRAVAVASHGYPLDEPEPGHAVQDAGLILDAVRAAVRDVVAEVGAQRVAGLSFSAAMHSLLGLDTDGEPLTTVVTWGDTRASVQAERLRSADGALALQGRTGTPLHPMSWLPKLVWFREADPGLFAEVRTWVGIKEYVLLRLCGSLAVDHSIASATGLLDLAALDWDAQALELAGITADRLPPLVPTTTVLPALLPQEAAGIGLPTATPVVVGAADGPLANLGVGAVVPGVAACSVGTSGALRVLVDRPVVDPQGRVFCYALTPGRWVVGGAINNGGVVLQWAGDALAPDLGEDAEEEITALAAEVPAGSGGLVMLPYLLGERAPHWSTVPRGAYVGLTRAHGRAHLLRAALEGVCLQLAVVLDSLRESGLEVTEVRATGGAMRSPLWRQVLADAFGMRIDLMASEEGSAFGAAVLGMEALGMIETIDVAPELLEMGESVEPEPEAAEVYARLRPVFAGLYHALEPAFVQLRELALPLEHNRPIAPVTPDPTPPDATREP